MSRGLVLIQLLFFLQLNSVWKCGIADGKGECITSVYRSTKIRITVARADCGCSSHQMRHGKFQQSGSGAMHPVSFIIKHCVPTRFVMHNKVGNIYNKHTQPFDHMAHSTTVKAQKPRRKKLKSTTSGRQHTKLLERLQWDIKPRWGRSKTAAHAAGNRDVPSGLKGWDHFIRSLLFRPDGGQAVASHLSLWLRSSWLRNCLKLRQNWGDPFYPLVSIIAAQHLQSIYKWAFAVLKSPTSGAGGACFKAGRNDSQGTPSSFLWSNCKLRKGIQRECFHYLRLSPRQWDVYMWQVRRVSPELNVNTRYWPLQDCWKLK